MRGLPIAGSGAAWRWCEAAGRIGGGGLCDLEARWPLLLAVDPSGVPDMTVVISGVRPLPWFSSWERRRAAGAQPAGVPRLTQDMAVHAQMLFKSAARKARTTKNVSKIKSAELLMLQISIQWPLSIVLSPRSMRMYQFCFRHLLNCKVRRGCDPPCTMGCQHLHAALCWERRAVCLLPTNELSRTMYRHGVTSAACVDVLTRDHAVIPSRPRCRPML